MAGAPKRLLSNGTAISTSTSTSSLRPKALKPESVPHASHPASGSHRAKLGVADRQSGVHPTEPVPAWWVEGLAACESEEVSADLSKDPRRDS